VEVLFEKIEHGRGASVSKVRLPATLVVRDSSRQKMGKRAH
jgi:DNA-binding LacI/PurR family transcriptional regulator